MRPIWLLGLMWGCNSVSPLSLECGPNTLTVDFPDFALDTDQVRIDTQLFPHTLGQAHQSYRVQLSGEVSVSALRRGATVVTSSSSLPAECGPSEVDLAIRRATINIPQSLKNQVDLLFLVDDSSSMSAKQKELIARFPRLMAQLDTLAGSGQPAWYHIGVVTSDLGGGRCKKGGLGARLQPLGQGHAPECQAPTGGLNFVDYNQLNGTNNLPPGQDLEATFTCMASVGNQGCGFEHQLEAVYQALHDAIPENRGFLRPDSLLVVVFVTDEDDCSAPADTDLFDDNPTYGPLTSYRCSRYGLVCEQGGGWQLLPDKASGEALQSCQAAPNRGAGPGKLFDISRYVDFFNKEVRADPNDVILASIAAPDMPIETILANPATFEPCTQIGPDCQVVLAHSCSTSPEFFGDPALRIDEVVQSTRNHQLTSICDPDYSGALTSLGGLIENKLGLGCFPGVVTDAASPDCTVREVSPAGAVEVPACSAAAPPCWRAVANPTCPSSCAQGREQRLAIHIDHAGKTPPGGTIAEVSCSVLSYDLTQPMCL